MKALGMHRAFIHVPTVIETCLNHLKFKKGDRVKIDEFAINLPYDIVSTLIFGEPIGSKVEKVDYQDPITFEKSKVCIYDAISAFVNDLYTVEGDPWHLAFPMIQKLKLKKMTKIIAQNNTNMKNVKEYLDRSKITKSVYLSLLGENKYPAEVVLQDCLAVMAVG